MKLTNKTKEQLNIKNNKNDNSPMKYKNKTNSKQIVSYKSADKINKIKNNQYLCNKISQSSSEFNSQGQTDTNPTSSLRPFVQPFNNDKIKKIQSDQESTSGNGLLQSIQFKKIPLLHSQNLESKRQNANKHEQKKQKSQNVSLKHTLKQRIQQFKFMQRMHQQQLQKMKSKLSVEQSRRLNKIHSMQKLQIHETILQLEKKCKDQVHFPQKDVYQQKKSKISSNSKKKI